jgi:hypothetical protein
MTASDVYKCGRIKKAEVEWLAQSPISEYLITILQQMRKDAAHSGKMSGGRLSRQ